MYILLVLRIPSIDIIVEAVLPVHNAWSPFAAHWKGIAHDGPLRFAVECHNLAEIVNQTRQVQPVPFRVFVPGTFRRLEGMHYVRQIQVRIGFVDQVVQLFQRFPDVCLEVIELEPLFMTTCETMR